jgi:hypothetical protein
MATSPNFSWPEPDNTDLVKNGALAIRTAVNAIDSSLVDLKGGTTGQVLSKASGTDMDFSWVAQDDSNAIQNAIVDAKGDIIAATANDTPARLAVGTNGQVLTADSTAATGLAWATASGGGYTELASGSLSGTSVALSSISSSYKDLQLVIKGATWGTGASAIRVQVNAITTGYQIVAALAAGSSGFTYALNGGSRWRMPTDATQDNTSDQNMYVFNVYDYSATNDTKLGSVDFAFITGGNPRVYAGGVALIGADAAISTLTISVESGATFNGGTYILYGVK